MPETTCDHRFTTHRALSFPGSKVVRVWLICRKCADRRHISVTNNHPITYALPIMRERTRRTTEGQPT